ncbi:hypothetical protein MPSEU_000044600 [Mayamaea pseudoterrestris]|nr:hypothetical protein MPSEU_000044600 [Mayamaea pseudoterrestris]
MAAAADPVQSGAMSSLVLQAAQSAAAADGLVPPPSMANVGGSSGAGAAVRNTPNPPASSAPAAARSNAKSNNNSGSCLRRGKWTPEEEAYANRLIHEFKSGLLPLTDGTTLRTFLSKLLNCDPMRISKKFVGSNCIGKQVFRRRNADLARLAPEQIQQSRSELSELERRFLERVSQTNRVKSSGVGGGGNNNANSNNNNQANHNHANNMNNMAAPNHAHDSSNQQPDYMNSFGNVNHNNNQQHQLHRNANDPPTPPWLKPPMGYKHGQGQVFAQTHLSGANARAAAAGRAMLEGLSSSQLQSALGQRKASTDFSDLLLQDLQQRASQQNLFDAANSGNAAAAAGLFAAAAARREGLAQLAAQNQGRQLGGGGSSNNNSSSLNDLMLKAGLSRDQLSQLARDRGLSSNNSLSHMMNRQNSFDALMSLDYQSLQSIDNLANLMQNSHGGNANHHSHHALHNHFPDSGMKNADFGGVTSNSFAAAAASNGDLSSAARRLASAGRMESLLKNISHSNVRDNGASNNSNATLSNLLQSAGGNLSAASLFNAANSASAASLANLLRQDSSTGLSALRMQEGFNHRNTSVDDFLSLVAAGDIPHQDPNLLNVPLLHQQQQQANGGSNGAGSVNAETAKFLAQHQHLLSSGMSNSALANALASRGSFAMQQQQQQSSSNNGNGNINSHAATSFALAQARANDAAKRKLDDLSGELEQQQQHNGAKQSSV